MVEKVSLKDIKRKVYTSYHEDGLIDISIAAIVLASGILMVFDMAWMVFISVTVGATVYAGAKKALTVPRIGFVRLDSYRAKAANAIVLGVLSLLSLLGVVAMIQTESGGAPPWLLFAIENYMIVIGVSAAASFCAAGYTFKVNRMYVYAFVTLTMFAIGYFLYYPLYYYLILLGSLILAYGLVKLARFVRKYPPSATNLGGSGSNEGK